MTDRWLDRLQALKRERDLALRDIGVELAKGKKQLEERAERQRAAAWSDYKRKASAMR